jgi:hypothetical protein
MSDVPVPRLSLCRSGAQSSVYNKLGRKQLHARSAAVAIQSKQCLETRNNSFLPPGEIQGRGKVGAIPMFCVIVIVLSTWIMKDGKQFNQRQD